MVAPQECDFFPRLISDILTEVSVSGTSLEPFFPNSQSFPCYSPTTGVGKPVLRWSTNVISKSLCSQIVYFQEKRLIKE